MGASRQADRAVIYRPNLRLPVAACVDVVVRGKALANALFRVAYPPV